MGQVANRLKNEVVNYRIRRRQEKKNRDNEMRDCFDKLKKERNSDARLTMLLSTFH